MGKLLKRTCIGIISVLAVIGLIIGGYQIDEKSIRHNPMGGIMFHIILNSDEKLVVYYTLQKDSRTGKIEFSGGGYSQEVGKLIKEEK